MEAFWLWIDTNNVLDILSCIYVACLILFYLTSSGEGRDVLFIVVGLLLVLGLLRGILVETDVSIMSDPYPYANGLGKIFGKTVVSLLMIWVISYLLTFTIRSLYSDHKIKSVKSDNIPKVFEEIKQREKNKRRKL